jgi:hypothetical protein
LSPDDTGVWDTLLSTLTPDPQPPSVGSSFASASASAVASQSTAVSSSTSLTGPETAEESTIEQPCESGFENSDSEHEEGYLEGHWPALPQFSVQTRVIRHGTDYGIDGPVDGPVSYVRADGLPSRRLEGSGRSAGVPPTRTRLRTGQENGNGPAVPGVTISFRSHRLGSRPPFRAEEEGAAGREAGALPPNTLQAVLDDEVWGGMRRIVRNLARREDIPDEWWAEAGFSRTLPQEP